MKYFHSEKMLSIERVDESNSRGKRKEPATNKMQAIPFDQGVRFRVFSTVANCSPITAQA